MISVVADTHSIIWYIDDPTQLSANAAAKLDSATNTSGAHIYISAITLIEICYLVEKKRIGAAVLSQIETEIKAPSPRVLVYSVNQEIAQILASVPRATVPDMPDRIISATALFLGLPLISRDGQIQQLTNVTVIW